MELILNLVWAVLALSSYALLFRHLAIRRLRYSSGPRQWQCIVALTCVLLILFPVISLTDDLHELQATAEEASSCAVIKRCAAHHESPAARTIHQAPYLLATVAIRISWAAVGTAAVFQTAHLRPALERPAPGRAPPVLPADFPIS